MIQRIQSIFLFVASALTLCLFFTPYVSIDFGQGCSEITVCHMTPVLQGFQPAAMFLLAILCFTAFILCFMSIFFFRNRIFQMKVVRINLLLQVMLMVVMLAYVYAFVKDVDESTAIHFDFYLTLVFPVVNMILLVLSRKRIKADDDLVKSADRLR